MTTESAILDTAIKIGQLLTPLGVIFASWVSWKNSRISTENGRRLEEVRKTTNGMAERAEAMARKLGVAEGQEIEKAKNGTP